MQGQPGTVLIQVLILQSEERKHCVGLSWDCPVFGAGRGNSISFKSGNIAKVLLFNGDKKCCSAIHCKVFMP